MKNYLIFSNDEIFLKEKKFSSNSNDTVNIIESINKKFKIFLFSKNSKKKFSFYKKLQNKIIRLDYQKILSLKKQKNLKIFMISLTLRNFINFIIIMFFVGKIPGYLYLRSDGHKEYKKKLVLLVIYFTIYY